MTSFAESAYRLLFVVLVGAGMGASIDVYRSLTRALRVRRIPLQITDGIFCLGLIGAALVALQIGAKLDVRFYVLLALAIGLAFYFSLASPLLYGVWFGAFTAARQGIVAFFRLLLWPVRTAAHLLSVWIKPKPPAGNHR